jgi:NAD(P)-dependent dehydrogenase (short-subunit alcohol dehydrogenase family)
MTDTHTNRRIALVTGANKGIGLEITRQLATRPSMTVSCARC